MKFLKTHKVILITSVLVSMLLFAEGSYILAGLNKESRKKHEGQNLAQTGYRQSESSIESEKPVNLLVLGLDDDETRSDIILIINFSPSVGAVNVLSIPRDTKVYLNGKPEKINALISYGGERLTMRSVKMITGLSIDYYLTLNLAGFRKIIDALGGVKFNVPFNMNYDDPDQNLHIHLKKGMQVLDGRKAEQLVRYRKGNSPGEGYEDADVGRIKMQQMFIKELIRQKAKLEYISKVDDIFLILRDNMATNIGIEDIRYFVRYATVIKPEDVKAYTIPGEASYERKVWYFIYNREETLQLIEDGFFK